MDCPHAASPQVLYAVLGSTIGERWKTFRQNSNEGDKEGDKDDEGYRRQDMWGVLEVPWVVHPGDEKTEERPHGSL